MRARRQENLIGRIAGTPTAKILDQAGPGGNREERHEQAQREHKARQDRKRAQAIARVDSWLKDRLAEGPAERGELLKAARAEGVPVQGGVFEVTLIASRERLGVVEVFPIEETPTDRIGWRRGRRLDTSRPHWALPGSWEEGEFAESQPSRRSAASASKG